MPSTILMIKMLNNDWINIVFISILILLSLNKFLFEKRFYLLMRGIFNKKYFSLYIKETPLVYNAFNVVFIFINILTFGLFFFFVSKEYFPDQFPKYDFRIFMNVIVVLVLYFILKNIFLFFINMLLLSRKVSREFSFYKLSFKNFSAVIVLFGRGRQQYSVLNTNTSLILLVSVFIIISAIGYMYSSYQIIERKQNSLFHIFLYLCTLEIVPTIIYIKFVLILVDNGFYSY